MTGLNPIVIVWPYIIHHTCDVNITSYNDKPKLQVVLYWNNWVMIDKDPGASVVHNLFKEDGWSKDLEGPKASHGFLVWPLLKVWTHTIWKSSELIWPVLTDFCGRGQHFQVKKLNIKRLSGTVHGSYCCHFVYVVEHLTQISAVYWI